MSVWSFRRASAWVVLAAFVSSLAVPVLGTGHAQLEDDASCDPYVLGGGHPTEQFEVVLPPLADDHCAICHWLRAVGGAAPRAASGPHARFDAATPGSLRPVLAGGRAVISEQPSRAPPVL